MADEQRPLSADVLAERDRCAKIAEEVLEVYAEEGGEIWVVRHILDEIRSGAQPDSERGGMVDAADLKNPVAEVHAGSSPDARTNGAAPLVPRRRAGGLARAAKLSAQRRSEIAKIAAAARWGRGSVQ